MTPTLLIWSLAVADILGVLTGYEGIATLHEKHLYPFWGNDGNMHTISIGFFLPPNWAIYGWDSWWGCYLLVLGCVRAPLAATSLVLRKNQLLLGAAVMLGWTLVSGLLGFWIWVETFFNVSIG